MKNSSEFFTTGELAKMTGLSKQLLIFYDRKKIFPSSSIESNGYRHYLLSQYFRLKIVITLRKLGVSLDKILTYLDACDLNALLSIYRAKHAEYAHEIERLQRKADFLEDQIHLLDNESRTPAGQVFIREIRTPQSYFRWTISMHDPLKNRILHIAEALRPYTEDSSCMEDSILAYLLPADALSSENNAARSRYSFLTHPIQKATLPPHDTYTLVPGIYLILHGIGHYGVMSSECRQILRDFMTRNRMHTDDEILIFPAKHCWMMPEKEWPIKIMVRISSFGNETDSPFTK